MVDMGLLKDHMMASGKSFLFPFLLAFCTQETLQLQIDRLRVKRLNASAMLPSTVSFAHQMRRAILITFVAAKPILSARLPLVTRFRSNFWITTMCFSFSSVGMVTGTPDAPLRPLPSSCPFSSSPLLHFLPLPRPLRHPSRSTSPPFPPATALPLPQLHPAAASPPSCP